MGSISESERSSGGGYGSPFQCSSLENPVEEKLGRLHSVGSKECQT